MELILSESVAWVAPIIAHPTTSGTFYVARQKVYRSTDNGGSWTAISANVNGTSAVREMAISKSNPTYYVCNIRQLKYLNQLMQD